jgi:hypothetical protein
LAEAQSIGCGGRDLDVGAGESAVWIKFSCGVLEGVLAEVGDFWWFFCGVDVVKCVVNVEKKQR